jgi:hypothetical protein
MRIPLAVTAAAVFALVCGTLALAMGPPKLAGTVGPGFTISLKDAKGKKVATLKPGAYVFAVSDKASIHNFTVNGPGVKNRTLTGTTFVGSKTVSLTLKAGKYTFYCTVHPTVTGTFTVK